MKNKKFKIFFFVTMLKSLIFTFDQCIALFNCLKVFLILLDENVDAFIKKKWRVTALAEMRHKNGHLVKKQ